MIQKDFANRVAEKIRDNSEFVGLAAGGSWITDEIDEFSDLDLVLVTETKISGNRKKIIDIASGLGTLLNAFTGEHIGEPRLLICLYDNPLLHVDLKFVTVDEFKIRVENPRILWERHNTLTEIINTTKPHWPNPDFQWIEDRFWTWIHYISLKIGRGEYFEALDSISFLRVNVISPLLQIRNNQLPRGLRKAELNFRDDDLIMLKKTVPLYEVQSIIDSLEETIELYQQLSQLLFPQPIQINERLRIKVLDFLQEIKKGLKKGVEELNTTKI